MESQDLKEAIGIFAARSFDESTIILKQCKSFLDDLKSSLHDYKINCTNFLNDANTKKLISLLLYVNEDEEEYEDRIDKLHKHLSLIAREYYLAGKGVKSASIEIMNYYSLNNKGLTEEDFLHADYLWNLLPLVIINEKTESLSEIDSKIAVRTNEQNRSLEVWEKKCQEYEGYLKRHHQNYNFLGLSKAFNDMFNRKEIEKTKTLRFLILFGVMLVILPFIELLGILIDNFPKFFPDGNIADKLFTIIPALVFEIILLYFFRIILNNYYSIKAQILQLDLRQSLCAFIEGYADFMRNDEKGKTNLEAFEKLIFSGITPETKNIPSTFDGVDQLVNLLKAAKAK